MNKHVRKYLTALAILANAWPLAAQVQTPPGAAPVKKIDEDVVVLSPFEVNATQDTGYQATQTLAGTRIRTDLKDVGSAIQVVTKEFLRDIGAVDQGTLLNYTTNTEVGGTVGYYTGLGNGTSLDETTNFKAPGGVQNRVRGLASADTTRDFFVTDIPWDTFNTDRIDIQRGPNAILFGLGSPAGIINASLHGADFRNYGELGVRVDNYGSVRSTVDVNQELVHNQLSIRLDGLWNDQKYEQEQAFQDDKRFYGAIRWDPKLFNDPTWHTSFKAKFEHGEIDANRPRTVTPNDAISPWFRPVNNNSIFGGMNKLAVDNGYDSWRTDNVVVGGPRGLVQASTANYQPWLSVPPNQQQPFWLIDGTTNQLYKVEGGFINTGARNNTGGFTGSANGLLGKRTQDNFYGLNNLPQTAGNANTANAANFPLAVYGQYKNMSMQDPTIFDFYNNLIDGPTKWENEKWNAYNLDFSQTAYDDRLGIQLSYDKQKYQRANEALLGGGPTVTMDILKNFADFYLTGASGATTTNPNFGRPYVQGAGSNGGSSYMSDREYLRASLFGEVRAKDFLDSDFWVKLLGYHRFNGVYANEKLQTENRSWQSYANSREWAGYWNGNDGSTSPLNERPPLAMIYLGSSVAARTSASGANIPGVSANVVLPDAGVHVFDPTWLNFGTAFGANWDVPATMFKVFNGLPNPESTAQLTQASNPANYIGWNSNFQDHLMRYNKGADTSLVNKAQLTLRETTSYAGTWQGFMWNDAIVPTLGWRYDEVKSKNTAASPTTGNRGILNLQPDVYRLPDTFPTNQTFKDHSTSGGIVVHLNKLFGDNDRIPFNISLSYNKSNNFQVTDTRRDVYGHPIGNPTGATKDYGILLSTKDGKYSFRAIKYETSIASSSTDLGNSNGLGGIVQQGLKWRNVFLYKLGVYDWNSRNQWATRNTWGSTPNPQNPTVTLGADLTLTSTQGRSLEDASIRKWNEAQAWLDGKGFFQAWGFTPQALSTLTDRTTYENSALGGNPVGMDPTGQFAPNPTNVFAYVAAQPQGFTVTADTASEGYEFEFTANPTPNWRITFNAAETTASRTNVGGPVLDEYVNYIDSLLATPIGTFNGRTYTVGNTPQFGNPGLSLVSNVWNPWRGNYALLKLQEGTNAPEVRKWRYNILTNYSFTHGRLRGVGVGASYRWMDKVIIGYPVIATDPTKPNFDLSKPYYGPSEDAIDLWVSYEHKVTKNVNWRIQLNGRNIGKSDGLIPISVQPDGQTWASVRVQPTEEWFVTNTFMF